MHCRYSSYDKNFFRSDLPAPEGGGASLRRHHISLPRLARPEGCLDVISILPAAWVVEPVGTRYRSDWMSYKCDIGPLDLRDGGLHIARGQPST